MHLYWQKDDSHNIQMSILYSTTPLHMWVSDGEKDHTSDSPCLER